MKLWILRFVPYEGGTPIDGVFKTQEAANKALKLAQEGFCLTDDFGVDVYVEYDRCAVVLTHTEASAAISAALQTANSDAAKAYGLSRGSTVQ